jgi:hypothetical protein
MVGPDGNQGRPSAQFIEQRLSLFQLGSIEAFGEPVVGLNLAAVEISAK